MAIETVRIAGWVFSVSFSSSSGPEKHSRASGARRDSSASEKVSGAAAKRSQNSFPIPTYCEPWPGKTKASLDFAATLRLAFGAGGFAGQFRFHPLPDALGLDSCYADVTGDYGREQARERASARSEGAA